MVSAFAARRRRVPGQVKAAEKSNEIAAIPAVLEMTAIEGAVVTAGAMGEAGQRFRFAKPGGGAIASQAIAEIWPAEAVDAT